MKKKVLIVFKYPHAWNENVIDKFSNYYNYADKKLLNWKSILF